MKVMKPAIELLLLTDGETMLKHIERCARKCYQSEHLITGESHEDFIRRMIDRGHESTIEHCSITADVICDRGVTHEIVRHRLCAFSQESTRYVNYSKDKFGNEITVIDPFFFDPTEELKKVHIPTIVAEYTEENPDKPDLSNVNMPTYLMNAFDVWFLTCAWTQWGYNTLTQVFGAKAQEARSVLPNSTKTAIAITANIREWRHIFKLRCATPAHPQMRQIMLPLLDKMHEEVPVVFDDYYEKYEEDIREFKNKCGVNYGCQQTS